MWPHAGCVRGCLKQKAENVQLRRKMSRVFITGSTDGLGLAAARELIAGGHEVLLHARSQERASAVAELAPRSLGVVIGDLSSLAEVHDVAEQVNALARWTQ